MNIRMLTCLAAIAVSLVGSPAWALKNGQAAPDFKVKDAGGKDVSLSHFKGKNVVLEWHNRECPFVKKHYDSGNMQKVQNELTKKGFVWLTIISSAKGKQGHGTGAEASAYAKEKKASPTAVLLDTDGKVGKAYGAKTSPHMFIVDAKGNIVYQGAIDDNNSPDPATIAESKNYVTTAADELVAGKKVAKASTTPYGCSVKYE